MPQSKIFSPNKTLNIRGRLMDLSEPKVMGILNITPDSFYKGSRHDIHSVIDQVGDMLKAGADFIDVGGYSSRPGAADIPEQEEINRVVPVIKSIRQSCPDAILSIDTFRSKVAEAALIEGAAMVNDISGGSLDPNMMTLVGQAGVPYIMMHMRGTPQNMSALTAYEDMVKEMVESFYKNIALAHQAGIVDIIIDPGFGFAKTVDQNFELLKQLGHFAILDKPILTGLSRKSMIWKTLKTTAENSLNGSTVLHTAALLLGASILRVHDVKEAKECIQLVQKIK